MFLDIDKISLREAFNNDNGRTSANKIVGVITSFVCMILVLSLIVFYFFNTGEAGTILALIDKTIMYFGCAAGLMGVKSVSNAIWRKNTGDVIYQGPIPPPEGYPVKPPRRKPKQTGQYNQRQPVQNPPVVEQPGVQQPVTDDDVVVFSDEPEECD